MGRHRKAREGGSSSSKGKWSGKVRRREQRCLDDYGVYNNTKEKCEPCEPCGDGRGRDFSDLTNLERDDVDGSHVCPPCRECPAGSYNNGKFAVTCQECVVNCKARNRIIQKECWRLGDNICGSCEKGYYDHWKNNDMPCEKNVISTPMPVKTASLNSSMQLPVQNQSKANPVYKIESSRQTASQQLPAPANADVPVVALCSVLGLIVLAMLIFLGVYLYFRRRRGGPAYVEPFAQKILDSRNHSHASLSHDNDIEPDARPETPTECATHLPAERLASYERQFSGEPRYYLQEDSPPAQPHGELSGTSEFDRVYPADTENNNFEAFPAGQSEVPGLFDASTGLFSSGTGDHRHSLSGHPTQPTAGVHGRICPPGGSVPNTRGTTPGQSRSYNSQPAFISPTRKCGCSIYPNKCHLCSGTLSNDFAQTLIFRDSRTLVDVANNVCHDPNSLYLNLGIPNAIIYQIDNDRDRVPELIPEGQNIHRMLMKWVEVKDKDATFGALCRALCASDFHHITDIIYKKQIF